MHILALLLLIASSSWGATIAVYKQDPIADTECAQAVHDIISTKYKTLYLTHDTLDSNNLSNVDCLVFPGGLGDVDNFKYLLKDKRTIVRRFFNSGKVYVGICMGAYLADKSYFNLLDGVCVKQYIKQSHADVRKEQPALIKCNWYNKTHIMYFFDGPVFLGNIKPYERIATYSNNCTAAIIKQTTGIFIGIGPHPESQESWYDSSYMKMHWHRGEQHKLLIDLLDKVLDNTSKS